MPSISISRNFAPFDELGLKVITQKFLFQSSAPIHFWASEGPRIFDPTSQDFSWGLDQRHSGDVACPSKKSTIVINVEGLNRKAFKEAGR
jgi:hypothetical protein